MVAEAALDATTPRCDFPCEGAKMRRRENVTASTASTTALAGLQEASENIQRIRRHPLNTTTFQNRRKFGRFRDRSFQRVFHIVDIRRPCNYQVIRLKGEPKSARQICFAPPVKLSEISQKIAENRRTSEEILWNIERKQSLKGKVEPHLKAVGVEPHLIRIQQPSAPVNALACCRSMMALLAEWMGMNPSQCLQVFHRRQLQRHAPPPNAAFGPNLRHNCKLGWTPSPFHFAVLGRAGQCLFS